jgi:hypothetical protein
MPATLADLGRVLSGQMVIRAAVAGVLEPYYSSKLMTTAAGAPQRVRMVSSPPYSAEPTTSPSARGHQ